MNNIRYSNKGKIVYEGKVVLKKWGNSQGIRITKEILDSLDISEGDTMELYVDKNAHSIILKKIQKKLKLEERLESFYGQPIDDVLPTEMQEVEWGAPKGEEVW